MSTAASPLAHASRTAPGASADAALLQRFCASRDEAAFAEIVRLHGPMVMGVCRRLLGSSADADDAFQAVFLVLARKASDIDPPTMLGHWLYGVAYRTASKARAAAATRLRKEKEVLAMASSSTGFPTTAEGLDPAALRELREIVDQEISALPRAYRQPIVACHLQGLSRAEAARQLNLNEGTLSSRLARGREMLAASLRRRGLAPAAIAVIVALNARTASAAVAPELAAATVRAATAYASAASTSAALSASSSAGASAAATSLAAAVLKTMALARLKLAGLITALLLFATSATLIYIQTRPPEPAPQNNIHITQPTTDPAEVEASGNKPDYSGTPR